MPTKPVVAVDLDGTIARYEQWYGEESIDDPIDGAIDFLEALHQDGFEIVVFSARAGTQEGIKAIWEWLKTHRLEQIVTEVTNMKQYRFSLFVDDRAVPFDGSYPVSLHQIRKRLGTPSLLAGDEG